MKILSNPELRGILVLFLVIVILGGLMAGTSGKLEQWFGLSLFSGPRLQDKIVFVSNGDINVMDVDGSHRTALTKDAEVLSAPPAISLLGNRIAFVKKFEKQTQVFSIGAKGGQIERLTSATGPKEEPQYTPDGKGLSFIASGRVYVADLNGDDPSSVLPTPEQIRSAMSSYSTTREIPAYHSYAWAPDSVTIAGVTEDEQGNDVIAYIPKHDHSPGASHDEHHCPQPEFWPVDEAIGLCWAAQKPVLAASIKIEKRYGLLIFDPDQGIKGAVAELEKQAMGTPALSPDGSEVAVPLKSEDEEAPSGLLRIDLHNGKGGIIAEGLFENPVYSPDGDYILVTLIDPETEKQDIATIDSSTGKMAKLTHDGKSSNAIWAPMSKK